MCPGLTNEKGNIDEEAEVGEVVAIMLEGKKHAAGIGRMAKTPEAIKSENKGVAIQLETYIMDGLWNFKVE